MERGCKAQRGERVWEKGKRESQNMKANFSISPRFLSKINKLPFVVFRPFHTQAETSVLL